MPRKKKQQSLLKRSALKWKTIDINAPEGKSKEALMYPFSGVKLWVRPEDKAETWEWQFYGNRFLNPFDGLPDEVFWGQLHRGFPNITAAKKAALAWFVETFAAVIDG